MRAVLCTDVGTRAGDGVRARLIRGVRARVSAALPVRVPRAAELGAALWAEVALRAARRHLAAGRLGELPLPGPLRLPRRAGRGVEALLRRRQATCLEGALVRQRWLAAHGVECEVVIGVRGPAHGFAAHAWLEQPGTPSAAPGHVEIRRLPCR